MPLQRSSRPSAVPLLRGAVLFDADPGSSVRCYHAAIVAAGNGALTLEVGQRVSLHEMNIDLRFGGRSEGPTALVNENTYLGFLPGPDSEQRMLRVIRVVSRLSRTLPSGRGNRAKYSLGPPGLVRLPSRGGHPPGWQGRFTCVSFVEWCYTEAGQDLVDDERLPKLNGAQIARLFRLPDRRLLTERAEIEAFLTVRGLRPGEGSWPVLLPGYQMRAFFEGEFPHVADLERDHVVNLERWERERRDRLAQDTH